MATVSIQCPGCGSTNVTQYKPDHYICSHCDTQFKWVDPNLNRVKIEKAVCSCGREAIGQCSRCGLQVCGVHSDPLDSIIPPEARDYFFSRVFPLLNYKIKMSDLLCEDCMKKEAAELQSKIDPIKASGKMCREKNCFSLELVRCEACGKVFYCNIHTPARKKYQRKSGLFGSSTQALTYERVCPECYQHARADASAKVYWD